MNRRRFLRASGTVLAAAATATATATATAGLAGRVHAGAASKTCSRVFVLVHGAWTGGWVWTRAAQWLRAKGHSVFVPTCTGVGERAHLLRPDVGLSTWIEDVAAVIEMENLHEVVLVGAGFGGVVITGVADRLRDRIHSLIYFDALVIPSGTSAFGQFSPEVQKQRREQIAASGNPYVLPAPSANALGLSEPALRKWVGRRLKPQPLRTYTDVLELTNPLDSDLRKVYVDCRNPPFRPLIEVKARLKSAPGWVWQEMNGSHNEMISNPAHVARILCTA